MVGFQNTVYIGFCYYGFSGQSGYSDLNPFDGPPSLHDSYLGYNALKFRPLCSEIVNIEVTLRSGTVNNRPRLLFLRAVYFPAQAIATNAIVPSFLIGAHFYTPQNSLPARKSAPQSKMNHR